MAIIMKRSITLQSAVAKLRVAETERDEYKEALRDVLDAMGVLTNPSELLGIGITSERIAEIIDLAKR